MSATRELLLRRCIDRQSIREEILWAAGSLSSIRHIEIDADFLLQNFAMISEYMSPQGRILHNKLTGLRPVNQRKIAKAIRRAIGMGIHPSTHRHPEILFGREGRGPRYQTQAQESNDSPKIKAK